MSRKAQNIPLSPLSFAIMAAFALLALAGAVAVAQSGGARITIKGGAFQPASLTIKAGDTVTWSNGDDRDHLIVSADGLFRSDNLSPGRSFDYTFKKSGSFAYTCKLHPREHGVIVAKD